MPRTEAVGMNVSRDTRDAIRSLSYRLTGETGQRVTMDEAMRAACAVAAADLAATLAALSSPREANA